MKVSSSANSLDDRATSTSRGEGRSVARADLENCRTFLRYPTGECSQAGEQLGEGEGLRQIVVRSGVEAGDAVENGISRGQHEDWGPRARLTKQSAHVEPVHSRQHHVEDDGVVLGCRRHP
jgi:hypothetical protein